jgi:DNA-binding PadR family transcriptional regulator
VSVRSSLLAILTMGPAYGFQLHGELAGRTAGRRSVNVGQIYGTLERLVAQGAVESAGSTPDGLPLYRLTPSGDAEATAWLHDTDSPAGNEWNDMVDRVLIASSLPHIDVVDVVSRYRDAWTARGRTAASEDPSGQATLSAAADVAMTAAAFAWLDTVTTLVRPDEAGQGPAGHRFHRELSAERPRRGRRPARAPIAAPSVSSGSD